MRDPYVYPGTDVLKNRADIQDTELLQQVEADYCVSRLLDLSMRDSISRFDFYTLCEMHRYIFQDLYEWAGKTRVINIEKAEPALGGISIEYADCFDIEQSVKSILQELNDYPWAEVDLKTTVTQFSDFMARLWRVHPYREGNTRTIVTFCCQFIETKGIYIDSTLFSQNARYLRTALVAASAIFHDLGDKRQMIHLERIVEDALMNGAEIKKRAERTIKEAGKFVTADLTKDVIMWYRHKVPEHEKWKMSDFFSSEVAKNKAVQHKRSSPRKR